MDNVQIGKVENPANPLAELKGQKYLNPQGYTGPTPKAETPVADTTSVTDTTPDVTENEGGGIDVNYGNTLPDQVKRRSAFEEASAQGSKANEGILDSKIPKWERMTIGDIITNPEYKGIRDSLLSQHINARGANFLSGLAGKTGGYESAVDTYNREQADRYSQARADRDARALEAELQAKEAANARDVGETLSIADTQLGRELDRYGLLYDTETKDQVLKQMMEYSKEFLEMPPEQKMALTAYQQYLEGDATMLDSLFGTYGPKLVEDIREFMKDPEGFINRWKNGGSGGNSNPVITSFGGKDYTKDEIVTRLNNGTLDSLISTLPVEEQRKIYNDITGSMNTSGWGKDVSQKTLNQLNNSITGRERQKGASEQAIKDADARADTVETELQEILNGSGDEKTVLGKLNGLKGELEKNISNGLVETSKVITARDNIENAIAMQNNALSISSIINEVPVLGKKPKEMDAALNNLAQKNWQTLLSRYASGITDGNMRKEIFKNTKACKDVVSYLRSPEVQNYIGSNSKAKNNYKYAVEKLKGLGIEI